MLPRPEEDMAFDVPALAAKLRIPLSRVFAVAAVAVFVFVDSPWKPGSWQHAACSWLGFALVTVGALGRLWSLSYISGHKNVQLVQEGPYSVTRNPLYFFSMIGAIGIACASRNPLVLALVVVFFLVYYPAVVRHEERVLASMHPQAFPEYARRVPRFLPRPSLYREPEQYAIRVGPYRRTFGDALAFLMGYLAIEVVVWLRAGGYLPLPTWSGPWHLAVS
jgi:protein-S-isoprenylcysteine O-methyltransferase Ste14